MKKKRLREGPLFSCYPGLEAHRGKFEMVRTCSRAVPKQPSESGVKDAKETRIYIYFDEGEEVIYSIGAGFKERQKADINEVKKLAIAYSESLFTTKDTKFTKGFKKIRNNS